MTNPSENADTRGSDPKAAANSAEAPPPQRLRLRLRTIEDCRREMARVYRAARAGKRDVADASKLGNLLAIIARTIEGSELARRVEELEERSKR